jgi:hypothetical protein
MGAGFKRMLLHPRDTFHPVATFKRAWAWNQKPLAWEVGLASGTALGTTLADLDVIHPTYKGHVKMDDLVGFTTLSSIGTFAVTTIATRWFQEDQAKRREARPAKMKAAIAAADKELEDYRRGIPSDLSLSGIRPERSAEVRELVAGAEEHRMAAKKAVSGADPTWSVRQLNDAQKSAFASLNEAGNDYSRAYQILGLSPPAAQ